VPGKYSTFRGWRDPFTLLAQEDPNREVASVLVQEGIDGTYSGALLCSPDGTVTIEGVRGKGVEFMLGSMEPAFRYTLPGTIKTDDWTGKEVKADWESSLKLRIDDPIYAALRGVMQTHFKVLRALGPCSFEWVYDYDATKAWIVQLHRGVSSSVGKVIYPGPDGLLAHRFHVSEGLEALRTLIRELDPEKDMVIVVGEVGITSHFGDLLRQAKIHSFIEGEEKAGAKP
jgi:hypothetical protein